MEAEAKKTAEYKTPAGVTKSFEFLVTQTENDDRSSFQLEQSVMDSN
jgi:hypothetical protein